MLTWVLAAEQHRPDFHAVTLRPASWILTCGSARVHGRRRAAHRRGLQGLPARPAARGSGSHGVEDYRPAGQVSDVVNGVPLLESSPGITGKILRIDGTPNGTATGRETAG
jgi:hypothetical protein